jgi:antibiotic biosynthesis monooxygenase (ABM) superfamily enzyme
VIELVTSSDYRALRAARNATLERSAVLAATPEAPFANDGATAYAVRLLIAAHGDSMASYQAEWSDQDAAVLARHQGSIVWRARVDPIVVDSNQRFEAMLVYGFADTDQRDAWVDDPERATLQTLQRRLFSRDVLLLAKADQETP